MRSKKIYINSSYKCKKSSTWKNINKLSINKNYVSSDKNRIQPKFFNKIGKVNCINIMNFLSYNDIKEIGKINRKFNFMIRTNNILVKFFRRKSSLNEKSFNGIVKYGSFSELQNISTTYNQEKNYIYFYFIKPIKEI